MTERPSWQDHALNIALASALRSEDPFCQVGAAVLDASGIVLGVGYNGTIGGHNIDMTERDKRRPFMMHAEQNALRYTTPTLCDGGLMAVTHFPCAPCVLLAASYNVHELVWLYEPDWERYPFATSIMLADQLGVNLHRIDARGGA